MVLTNMTNLWSSVEAFAWMSGLAYEDYAALFMKEFPKGKPFRESFYIEFGKALDNALEEDLEE